MDSPRSASDLRLVPHYIQSCCTECGNRLVLIDREHISNPLAIAMDNDLDSNYDGPFVWWDEWECINESCSAKGLCYLDQPLTRRA